MSIVTQENSWLKNHPGPAQKNILDLPVIYDPSAQEAETGGAGV
jgi:hypothetical protein